MLHSQKGLDTQDDLVLRVPCSMEGNKTANHNIWSFSYAQRKIQRKFRCSEILVRTILVKDALILYTLRKYEDKE